MSGITLDAGALIAIDDGDRRVALDLRMALRERIAVVIPAGVLAQTWRDGSRQARLALFASSEGVRVEALDERRARAAGQLCGLAGTSDVIDASVVIGARMRGDRVYTSDAEDLRRLDPGLALVPV